LLEGLKIPAFGILYRKIRIAQYRLHFTWKQEQDEEMRFQKRQTTYKKSHGFQPVIPLVPTKLSSEELKDKAAYITFTLQITQGSGPGTPNYKKSIRTFDEGDPQQWMEVITGLREIWAQNSVTNPADMSNTVMAILKGDSLSAYEAAMEDNRTDPDDETLMVPMTTEHIDDALLAITNTVFPFRALETQKQWMSKYMKKPYDMSAKTMTNAMSRINNYLPFFPKGTPASKYTEEELITILEFAVPDHWRKAFDLRDYVPADDDKLRFINECERVERHESARGREREDDDEDDRRTSKKTKFAKSEKSVTKSGKKSDTSSESKYCTHCKTDTHNTEACWKLKKIAREKELSDKKSQYSKRTFRKEVNAIARKAGKHGDIKIVEKAIKREQGKHDKKNKKNAKVVRAKKAESSDSDSSDGSMHVMEPGQRIPRKKKFAQRTIRMNAKGKTIDIENSDSEDGRKMPAKISRKKPKKVADLMDTDSSTEASEHEDLKVSKEEKAFLKSIDKKEIEENSDTDSD
jgi:hypothetical protein